MQLIYTKEGFTKNEKEEWRVIIFNNILDGLRLTLDAMEEFGISFEYENTTVRIALSWVRVQLLIPFAGPPPNNHAREGSPAVRVHPN